MKEKFDPRDPASWNETTVEVLIGRLDGEQLAPDWSDVMSFMVETEIASAVTAQLEANVSTEAGRAAFYEAKGRRLALQKYSKPIQAVLQVLNKAIGAQ